MFYITPIDYEAGEHSLGRQFSKRVGQNIVVLQSEMAKGGCSVLDLSNLLSSDAFDWRADLAPNEHLNFKGRKRLAAKISETIWNQN